MHDITTYKCNKRSNNPIDADSVKETVKFSFPNSCGKFFSPIWSINDTKKRWRAHSAGFKPLKTTKTCQIQKKGCIQGIFAKNTPFFGPGSGVFEIALVSLVGVGTYKKILRPTRNPTLAGMDPLTQQCAVYAR